MKALASFFGVEGGTIENCTICATTSGYDIIYLL